MTMTESSAGAAMCHAPAPGTGVHPYIGEHRAELRRLLLRHGAAVLRGFDVGGVDGFDGVVRAFSGSAPLTYAERSSPRSTIKGQVYTSTDYPRCRSPSTSGRPRSR